jgi:hypothetical protein
MNRGMVATWMQSLPENRGKTISTKDVTASDMTRFMAKGMNGKPLPNNHPYTANQDQMWRNEAEINNRNIRIKKAQDDVARGYTPQQEAEIAAGDAKVAALGDIKLDDGSTISSSALFSGIKSGVIKVSGGGWFGSGGDDYTVNINGKEHRAVNKVEGAAARSRVENSTLLGAINTIQGVRSSKSYKKYDNDVNDWFTKNSKNLVNTLNLMTFAKGSYEAKTMEAEMHNIFPEAQYSIQSAGIGSDAKTQGNAYFYITPKDGTSVSEKDIQAYLVQRGYGEKNVTAIKQTGTGTTVYEIKNYKSPITSQYAKFNQLEKAVIEELSYYGGQNQGNIGSYESAPYKSYSPRQLQVKQDHGSYYLMMQGLNGGNTMDMFPWTFNDPASAVLKGQQLTATIGSVPEAMLQEYLRVTNQ